ncbi:heme oxygenase (biliverdin-producing) [Georgenia sp. Z1344]|uniref:biliverdin-producing heme oxygenase n=1 Tax=Georgenia sp. Z1344 TaxID=3416706 RepID=UPI003CEACAED
MSVALSELLRSATAEEHTHAETRTFVTDLMGGALGRDAYIDLARQHHAIYTALEAAGRRLADHPVAGEFVRDELLRVPSIAADLHLLAGPDWADLDVLPVTHEYVARLEAIDDAPTYLAHAYTRYLGDLSGGQVIARMLQRHYGMTPDELTFYTFTDIPKPKPYKDAWRAAMDAADLTEAERERCAAEAKYAFDLNAAVFVALGERPRAQTVAEATA